MRNSPKAFSQAPLVESARLSLRSHGLEDFESCAALWADPIVTRYIGGKPLTREECWTRLLRYLGHWSLLGYGYWVAEEKATGRSIGELGFADYKRGIHPSLDGAPEAGWAFIPSAHGKGYATEAVLAILRWGEIHLTAGRTHCLIDPQNAASLRVAAKCGYHEYRRTSYKGQPTIILVRESPVSVQSE